MVYFVLALVAITMVVGGFGIVGTTGAAAPIAQILFAFFLVAALLSLLVGLIRK